MFVVVYTSKYSPASVDLTPCSLLNDEVSKHLEVFGVGLLIVDLIVVANEAVKNKEVAAIGDRNRRQSQGPSALDQLVAAPAPIQDSAHADNSGNGCNESTEARLSLPDAEALVIVKEVGRLLYLVGLRIAQLAAQILLAQEQGIDFG